MIPSAWPEPCPEPLAQSPLWWPKNTTRLSESKQVKHLFCFYLVLSLVFNIAEPCEDLNLIFHILQSGGLSVRTSGVTSRGAKPVPPVVRMRFSSSSSHHSKRVSCTHVKKHTLRKVISVAQLTAAMATDVFRHRNT